MGSNRLKWEKRNKIEAARDFSQSSRKYLYSEIEPKKETTMECGMCGDETPVTKDLLPHLNEGVMCVPCQDYVLVPFPEYSDPVPA